MCKLHWFDANHSQTKVAQQWHGASVAKGTHDYQKFIKPSELAHDIRGAGLKLKDMTGLHYNPLTKRYWLAPNVDVNYMVYTVKEGAA
jgi:2-polyprenyl-6-hydroxyphenyl methylase / 3-demethylubiquinone-9 3-methyltransferase